MDEHEGINRLIDKIDSGLPQIKVRSITSLYTKVTLGIINPYELHIFQKLPGVFLNWINKNSQRSQTLFKVLTILSYFSKYPQGLVLLEQYEASDFFKGFRQYLLTQSSKQDYINILETMIKVLLPLQPQTPSISQVSTSNIPLEQSKISQKQQDQQPQKQQKVDKVVLTWVVSKESLGKKQEDQIYSLFMQLRHGKRELQLEWLKRIHQLIKYWGYKWFRFKADLINELVDQFPSSKLKWLIIDIIRSALRTLNTNSQKLKKSELDIINLNHSKPISGPDCEQISIQLNNQLFTYVYSASLLSDILTYQFPRNIQMQVEEWILLLPYQHCPHYFITVFERVTSGNKRQVSLSTINKQIEYYCLTYPKCRAKVTEIVSKITPEWQLQAHDFPTLVNYLHQAEINKSYQFISKYDQQWQLGSNLHLINEVMSNLEKGIQGIHHSTRTNQLLQIYINCLLTLGAAVEKQDPLMTHYPNIKVLISKIIQIKELEVSFYQEVLTAVNSHSHIKYGSKSYICSQLALMIFSENSLFQPLFSKALAQDQCCACWLQITKRLILTNTIQELDSYSSILLSLTYHHSQHIQQLSQFLIGKLSKMGKLKVLLCRLFSVSEEERRKISSEMFKDNAQRVWEQIQSGSQTGEKSKKLLKIGVETIQNYIKIVFNRDFEEHIQRSAAEQLLQSVERAQIKQDIFAILLDLSDNIRDLLNVHNNIPESLVQILIQIRAVINSRTKSSNHLNLNSLILLLRSQLSAKVIKIVLKELYRQCFQNPFSQKPEMNSICLMYPQIRMVDLPVSEKSQIFQFVKQIPTKKQSLIIPNYRQTKDLEHMVEWIVHQTINQEKIVLDQLFVDIVQKQIGFIIHASKGFIQLHLISFMFQYLKNNGISIPEALSDHSAPLLNSLLTKDTSPINNETTAQILSVIGNKRTRQLNNLITNGPPGTWKLFLMSTLQNIDPDVIQASLKGLLGLHYGREASLILKTLKFHIKNNELSQFSKSLIVSSCLKFFRQDSDQFIRKMALCLLIEIYGTANLPLDGQIDLFSSLTAVITEQQLPSDLLTLALVLVKLIVKQDGKVVQQKTVLKLLLSRLLPLTSLQGIYKPLQAATLQLFRTVLSLGKQQFLAGADLIDLSLPLLSLIEKSKSLSDNELLLMCSALDILYLNCHTQPQLPKYLLSSTRLQSQLLQALCIDMNGHYKVPFLESISRLWLTLSINQQDLFIYKLSQLLTTTQLSLMGALSSHLQSSGSQYMKMVGWTVVIWAKHRQPIDQQFGDIYSKVILNSSQSHLIKMILPFSLKAKQNFLSSSLLLNCLKVAMSVVEGRIVKDVKDKKKKGKIYVLMQKQSEILEKTFDLLSSLFYWNNHDQIDGGDGLKRVISFLQKFYLSGTWQTSIMKQFLKTISNMAMGNSMIESVAIRLSQSTVYPIPGPNFVQEIANCIIRSESIEGGVKMALRLASSLSNIQSVRAQLLRSRIVQQLSSRLIKNQQKGQLNLQYTMEVVELLVSFSSFKDSNTRILNDKRLAELLINLLKAGKLSMLEERIAKLINNLACYKHNKPTLMNCKDLHKVVLGLIEESTTTYRPILLSLLYNLLYKNSQALKIYRKPQVIELIRAVGQSEGESVSEICGALREVLEGEQA